MVNMCNLCRDQFASLQSCVEHFLRHHPNDQIAILKPEFDEGRNKYTIMKYDVRPVDLKGGIESLLSNEETWVITYRGRPEAQWETASPPLKSQRCSLTPVKQQTTSAQPSCLFNSNSDLDTTIACNDMRCTLRLGPFEPPYLHCDVTPVLGGI